MYRKRSNPFCNMVPLKNCPVCGMDSGARYGRTRGTVESYFVRCNRCKAETRDCKSQGSATRAWNEGRAYKKEGRE